MLKRSVSNMVGEMADGAITSGTKLGVSMMVEIVARILVARNAKMILLRLRKLLLSKYKLEFSCQNKSIELNVYK